MKKLLCLSLALAATASFGQSEDPNLRREIQATFAKLCKLMAKEDMPGLLQMVAPGFYNVDTEGGRMTLEQCKTAWAGLFKNGRDIKCDVNVKHVQRQGREASVWYEMTISANMKNGQSWSPTKWSGRYCETMISSPTGWLFAATQGLPMDSPWSFKTGGA